MPAESDLARLERALRAEARLGRMTDRAECAEALLSNARRALEAIAYGKWDTQADAEVATLMEEIAVAALDNFGPFDDKPVPPHDIARAADLARDRDWKDRAAQ